MTSERRKILTLSSLILCGMLMCAFFSLRHSAFQWAFRILILMCQAWLLYYIYNLNRRMPDTLIHLFPEPLAKPKERS
jgi:hypothetical protein